MNDKQMQGLLLCALGVGLGVASSESVKKEYLKKGGNSGLEGLMDHFVTSYCGHVYAKFIVKGRRKPAQQAYKVLDLGKPKVEKEEEEQWIKDLYIF